MSKAKFTACPRQKQIEVTPRRHLTQWLTAEFVRWSIDLFGGIVGKQGQVGGDQNVQIIDPTTSRSRHHGDL